MSRTTAPSDTAHGGDALALRERADALNDAGDTPGAVAVLAVLVAAHPKDRLAWNALAMLHIAARNFAGALVASRRALDCDPRSAADFINAGIALRELGRLEESRVNLAAAVNRNRDTEERDAPLAHLQLARTLQRIGAYHSAAAEYVRAIVHAPRAGIHGQQPNEVIAQSIGDAATLPDLSHGTAFLRSFTTAARALTHSKTRTPTAHAALMDLIAAATTDGERTAADRLLARYWRPR